MNSEKSKGSTICSATAVVSVSLAMAMGGWTASAFAAQQAQSDVTARDASAPRTIALVPGAGQLGEAVAAELKGRGYGVAPFAPAVASLGAPPAVMPGVDAILTIRTVADADGVPENVTALMTSTNGNVLARVNWRNYWGGWRGPKGAAPQRDRRRTFTQAAAEIAEDLVKTL
jgi:hypothetical protein